jgi:deazaflavin-dependent oxidoreductase (nitroreductase family)
MAPSLATRITSAVITGHGKLYLATDGLVGHSLLGVPCLILRTVGAKTGEPRAHSLTYAMDGNRYLVVASTGGGPKNPAWLHNVRKNPDVIAQIGRKRVPVTASTVLPGDADYDRLWTIVNDNNKQRYAAYQRLTTRPIPVVVLTPKP